MPVKKRGLGRGLDALLGVNEPSTETLDAPRTVRSMPIAHLKPNPYQPRTRMDPDRLEELAASIQQSGIIQPLIARKSQNDQFEIVAGERRWRAAQRIGLSEVPVVLKELDDEEMLELALVENLQRDDLNPVEEARAYKKLIEEFELSQESVAHKVGKSRVAVTNSLRLLRLPEKILRWIEEGAISAGHARSMLSLENESLQLALAREIMSKGLNVREVESRVRRLLKAPDPTPKAETPTIELDAHDLEEKLSIHLGLRVRIAPRSNTEGKIEVYYSTLDEFSRFFDHLGISLQEEL